MRYFVRAVKYFIKLMILLAVIFALMVWSGTSEFSADGFFNEFFSSLRGRIFSVVVILWCAVYPKVEYITRHVSDVEVQRDRPGIISAFEAAGMRLESRSDTELVFRSASLLKRMLYMGEDTVRVTASGDGIDLDGSRRQIADTEYRIKLYTNRTDA